MDNIIKNLRKYQNYIFDTKSFSLDFDPDGVSDLALRSAESIRGHGRPPAVIIHGIMKRSGTVYVGELLSLHPEIHSYPNKIWEVPFLPQTGKIQKLQRDFFLAYEQNIGRVGENDFLPIFGASFINYLYTNAPDGHRLLVKMPGVQYLNFFYSVFPSENLLLLIRDGRDVVSSTIKTWQGLRFADVCLRWDRSAKMVLEAQKVYSGREGFWLGRFEDAVKGPEAFVREACKYLGLDTGSYPFERINALPVIGSSTTRKEPDSWMKKTKDFNPIGRWHRWSGRRKRVFKRIAGESLIALGYCENLDW